ncbi:protein of unknown function [Methanoculleus bourgensis]|uniref:Uncharacterized protein n=1 Tax=Methanoculleus bourgensis TaxID=83986 RepID=A0A0X8XY70_9EURY|nr:protein of unknown function [Methanoculleus bourgensis]
MVRHNRGNHALRGNGLQWSHVFSDMVSGGIDRCDDSGITASMEPCLFRHGKEATIYLSSSTGTSFNGAMSFQTW